MNPDDTIVAVATPAGRGGLGVVRFSGAQAVAIARAVHFKNKMLLLDEPTSALSVRETENVLQYITRLRTEGVSCVFVTHNIYHAYQVCDRFVVMSHGRVALNVARADTSIDASVSPSPTPGVPRLASPR